MSVVMKAMPRYRFHPNNMGCADHNDPDCLCDVKIDKPVELYRGPLMFAQTALDHIDEHSVSTRNFEEFARTFLGAFELYRRTVAEEGDPCRDEMARSGGFLERNGKQIGPDIWRRLSDEQREALRHHYTIGTDWSVACAEVEGVKMTYKEEMQLRKFYANGRASAFSNANRRSGAVRKINCQHCGVIIHTKAHTKRFCSDNCRVYWNRANKQGETS